MTLLPFLALYRRVFSRLRYLFYVLKFNLHSQQIFHTHTHTHTTHTQTNRDRFIDRERERQTERQRDRETERETERQRERQRGREKLQRSIMLQTEAMLVS